jgi:hypothetical protein
MSQELLAGRREPRTLPATLDQLHTGKRFQFAQCFRHRRLAQVQPLSRTPQVALLRNGNKAAQMAKADA